MIRSKTPLQATAADKRSWLAAYGAFLLSRDESLILKVAPLALVAGSPELIASNLVPVVGELLDVGGIALASVVVLRTLAAIQKYR